jgi:carboxymethylenebutenolidase
VLIDVAVPGGTAEAWVSRPEAAGDHPGVLLFMDAYGIRPQIGQMADRIATWGYVVLAPNVFHRNGRIADVAPTTDLREPGGSEAFFAQAYPRVRALTPALAEPDIVAYVDDLLRLPGVARGPIGVTGYCMGARLALRASYLRPDAVAACGGFHGGGLATEDDDSPHRGLPAARAAFVFGHADHDRSMPPEAIERLDRALADAGLEHVSEMYTGASHGYTMADTAAYDEAAAERHYDALEALFARTLAPQ